MDKSNHKLDGKLSSLICYNFMKENIRKYSLDLILKHETFTETFNRNYNS